MDNFQVSVKRFDEFASEYAQRFMNIDSYSKHFDKFCSYIDNRQPKILELGCGPGNVTKYLKERFPHSQITAIDLAPKMIEIAKQTVADADFRVMDVRNIKTINSQFNAIMCSFCLPFLSKDDANKLISDSYKKLAKNGILYISTMEGDESKAGFESTSFSGDSQVYFNYHNHKDLEISLINNGFSLDYNIRQDYHEPNGSITTDLIMIGKKN
jgi:ubiquinone/menaquinone biosynthesis C-methylase UbiE